MAETTNESHDPAIWDGDEPTLEEITAGWGPNVRFAMAALGALPWIGSMMAAAAALKAEREQGGKNEQLELWLQEHQTRLDELALGLATLFRRVESFGAEASQRLNEESYLTIARKAFRVWDRGDTKTKRDYVFTLLTNAAGTRLCHDDVVRLFLDWIDRYHDVHFGVIRAIFQQSGLTRLGIWRAMGNEGPLPAENSSEADLYRMLIHDLSTGRLIRQHRDFDKVGFRRKEPARTKGAASRYMKSSWDDEEVYELSVLGQDFVRYVLQDAVTRLGAE